MDDQNGWDTAAGTPAFAADGNVDPDLDVLVHRIERDALEALSPRRYEHSRGCAAFAAAACARAGLDPRKGLAAGWAHDLARSLPQGRQEALALACPVPLPASVFRDPVLMHGPAAATLLARRHGVRDWDILEAVALHTVGRPDMGPLAKIVWAADKMEEGRGHVDGAERARCLGLAPDDLLLQALAATISWLRTRGREVAPETLDLYNSLR
ncbi:MAG TPA: bis(5'-nucleosyl)-tetraphosphatase (symmetrical) YqeK, partial [Magnetospirillaceae bacterium]|nr:bis(5'-nucleosyl)-tetraphosphatase (symmetrical) YqeK [Magnetospirillaceae bacterium]